MLDRQKIESLIRKEMAAFHEVARRYPGLERYGELVEGQLMRHYALFSKYVESGMVGKQSLALNGLLLRSLNYYRGALWSLGERNPHVFADCLRSICETVALAHYINRNPGYLTAATAGRKGHEKDSLRVVNVKTMVEKLDGKHKGALKDYEKLCERVHPNPESLYANVLPLDESGRLLIGTTSPKMSEKEADVMMRLLIHWTGWLFDELQDMGAGMQKGI